MKITLFFFFVAFTFCSYSQKDSLKKEELSFSTNPVFFADYHGANFYPGMDVNLYYRQNHILTEFGVLGGNSYPIIPNLNYYLGTGLVFSCKKSWEVLLKTRFMFSYYSYSEYNRGKYIRYEESLLLGAGVLKKINRFKVGIEYYSWWSRYNNSFYPLIGRVETIYAREGFVPTGILSLKFIYILKNKF